MHCFDMLIGTGTGAPVLASGAESDFVTDQMFVPVSPVDHLATIKPPMNRPAIATPHWGVTSFDLACKVADGDRRWIDQVLKPTKLIPRIVVYATPRGTRELASYLLDTKQAVSATWTADAVLHIDVRSDRVNRISRR